jgi:hypothetical protein
MDRKTTLRNVFIWTCSILIMVLALQGCKKNQNNGSGEYLLSFYWTPAGSTTQVGPWVETYKFYCFDGSSYPGCNIVFYQDEPHQSGNWMSYPENQSNCSDFAAVVTVNDGAKYFFFGNMMEPLKTGGLRASGYYDKEVDGMSVESGTFTAYSDFIEEGSSPPCSGE